MSDCYITFRSLTRAQLGSAVLEQNHIPHQLLRAPRPIAEKGCGYALRLNGGLVRPAVQAIHESGVVFERIFAEREDGSYGEMTP